MQELETHEHSLTSALRAVAEDEAGRGTSAAVEVRLRAEVRSLARARRRRGLAALVAVAAAVCVAVAAPGLDLTVRRSLSGGLGTSADPGADGSSIETATTFFPLLYVSVPMTGGQIVRLEVPQTTPASFGVAPADLTSGARPGTVLADVLVGEDGLARAIRFVRPITTFGQKEPLQ